MFKWIKDKSEANKARKEKEKIAQQLRSAAGEGDLETVLDIIKDYGHDLEIINHAPAESGHWTLADGTEVPETHGNAVWWAAFKGQMATLQALLEVQGIEINGYASEHQMNTPLLSAIIFQRGKIALVLAARPDLEPNKKNIWGEAPILHAVHFCPAVIPVLLKHPEINPNVTDGSEQTALHLLCRIAEKNLDDTHKVCIKELAQHKKTELDKCDDKKFTPLMRAAESGNKTACQALLRAGARKDLVNGQNCTALRLAELYGHNELAEFIKNYQPDSQADKLFSVKSSCAQVEMVTAATYRRLG